jgi:hypothetical protein
MRSERGRRCVAHSPDSPEHASATTSIVGRPAQARLHRRRERTGPRTRRIASEFPRATLVSVPGAKTWVPIDNPAAAADAIIRFVPTPARDGVQRPGRGGRSVGPRRTRSRPLAFTWLRSSWIWVTCRGSAVLRPLLKCLAQKPDQIAHFRSPPTPGLPDRPDRAAPRVSGADFSLRPRQCELPRALPLRARSEHAVMAARRCGYDATA